MWLFAPFRIDAANQTLYRENVRVAIMPKPFAVLCYLVDHHGRLVAQDELLKAIWPETHVQPEVLRRYILEIRRALGDDPDSPRFIETIPKRGYRFVAAVEWVEPEDQASLSSETVARSKRISKTMVAVCATGVLLAGAILLRGWQPRRLSGKDQIVLGEFMNMTGDPIFDGTLRQGLEIQLEQSPFLRIAPQERIRETLRLMERPPDTKLTPEVARQVCLRAGASVVLDGSISAIGERYVLMLQACNCSNGESIAATEVQAAGKNHVLDSLGQAASNIRRGLGESLPGIQKFDTPLVRATTPSLDALRAYSLAYREVTAKGNFGAAIPLLQRAVSLDANFALAYSTLAETYWDIGENALAAESTRKAYELRARLSEWEKLRVESDYDALVLKDSDKERRGYQVWAQTYPNDWVPHNRLGVADSTLGLHEEALTEFRKARRLYPESGLILANLALTLVALNRPNEVRSIAREAESLHLDPSGLQVALYRLAFLQRDFDAMKRQVAQAHDKPSLENELVAYEAASAGYFGHVNVMRKLTRDAVEFAERTGQHEAAAMHEASAAMIAALFGFSAEAGQRARSALGLGNGEDVEFYAALALAFAGDLHQAGLLDQDMERRFPRDTFVQFAYLPTLRAQLALARNEPLQAIQFLQSALPYDMAAELYPSYIRGLAYLALSEGQQAEVEFHKVLANPGVVLYWPIGTLAQLQLARAFAAQGKSIEARAAYENFLMRWKNADADIPVLARAQRELGRL